MSQNGSFEAQNDNSIIRSGMVAAVVLVPLVVYGYMIVRFSTDVPYMDDYGAVLSSMLPGNSGLSKMFAMQNEHRIAWTRFVVRLYLTATGTINFRYLPYIGNSALVALLAVYGFIFRYRRLRVSAFIPVSWIMFAPLSWENMTWAMASIQNYFSILFAITSFYLWSRKPVPMRIASIILASVATYTSGYGLMVLPVIVFMQLMEVLELKKMHSVYSKSDIIAALVQLGAVILIATVIIGLYFVNFHTSYTGSRLNTALANPVKCITFMLCYFGSSVPGENLALSVGAGIGMVSFFLVLMWKRYYRINPANTGLLIYVLLNGLVVALSRTAFGVHYALSSRYTVISMPAIIALYIGIIETWPALMTRRSAVVLFIVAAIIFNILWLPVAVDNLSVRQIALDEGIQTWCKTGLGLSNPNQNLGTTILKRSIRYGIYAPPCTPEIPVKEGRTLFKLAPPAQKIP